MADDDGKQQQAQLVQQALAQQPGHQGRAAADVDVLAWLLLEPGDLPATSPRIRVEFSHPGASRVVETTTLGTAFIVAAMGSLVFPANEAANVS